MSADFWAGYLSGAVGIVVGNPLDIVKLRHQTQTTIKEIPGTSRPSVWMKGTAAPILGYGALNGILFVSHNRSENTLKNLFSSAELPMSGFAATWVAGALGGLATWFISAPTELIKCRAQLSPVPVSSWAIARQIWRADGIKGLYFGGLVTALRDSIGYGFYFWAYEVANYSWLAIADEPTSHSIWRHEAPKILVCGGVAGVATWASIFPLDCVKSRVQTQLWSFHPTLSIPSLGQPRLGAWQVARRMYNEGGLRPFFRGLTICSARAFVVNAVQWTVYESAMRKMGHGHQHRPIIQDNDNVVI